MVIFVVENGINLYADQPAAASLWINMAYQGSIIVQGLLMFLIFLRFFDLEKKMPQVAKELQDRKVAEYAAKGMEYIPASELERREIEEQNRIAEENRVKDLREKCAKTGKDFDTENNKVLAKRAAQAEKATKKAEKRAKRAGNK